MSVADAVGTLPGGGAFAALWTQVDGDPGAIDELAGRLRATAAKAERSTHALGRTTAEVADAWHGPAAEAFTGYMHHFGAAGGSVHAGLDKAAGALEQAARAVDEAKSRLTSIANRILDTADELAPLRRTAETYSLWQSAVIGAVHNGCLEAAPVVSELCSHLDQAASLVRSCVHSGGWVAMRAADSGTYLPAPGKPIRWNPIPHGLQPAATVRQSSTSGPAAPGSVSAAPASTMSTPAPTTPPTGTVKQWIDQARELLIKSGVPASRIDEDAINLIIQHESSGNPLATNGWDSNAAAGHPSKGLMQTIDSTFAANALPGHTDIWNPVDNIVAGVRYALGRYGSLDNVPGVAAVHNGQAYVGY